MARKSHRQNREPPELDITAFLNLMVVLVPFLLITAVFSRITILQLNLPASVGEANVAEKKISLEVIVRKERIDIGDGEQIITRIPNIADNRYDIKSLSNLLLEIKSNYPSKLDATVLMEADIEYEYLVQVMDAVGGAEVRQDDGSNKKIELFPEISVGDAPLVAASQG